MPSPDSLWCLAEIKLLATRSLSFSNLPREVRSNLQSISNLSTQATYDNIHPFTPPPKERPPS